MLRRVNVWRVLSHRVFCRGHGGGVVRHSDQSVFWKTCFVAGFLLHEQFLCRKFCRRDFVTGFLSVILLSFYSRQCLSAVDWSQEGYDCLHLAAANGHHKVVKLLLSQGADTATRNTVRCSSQVYFMASSNV